MPGERNPDGPFSAPGIGRKILTGTELAGLIAHVLRRNFARTANDSGFTETTIAALLGHASGSIVSRYVHSRIVDAKDGVIEFCYSSAFSTLAAARRAKRPLIVNPTDRFMKSVNSV